MARDPFAPVTQPSIPPWLWVVGGVFVLLFIGMGITLFVVLSRRAVPPPAVAAPPQDRPPAAVAPPAATASTASAPAPDRPPGKAEPEDKSERPHRAKAHARRSRPAEEGGARATPPPPPKRKHDMSQKEIDSLLGL
ncbi:MAG: hypothetical protein RMK29_21330 [Myxococcales bacterium]|nr:hypothetical protein [Myxococcota bacterium]MDW8284254.1 hypothetical protein [Myxococcales bacterium]